MKFAILAMLISFNVFAGKFFDRTARTLFKEESYSFGDNWVRIGSDEKESIKILLRQIYKSSSGKKIIKKARRRANGYGKTLTDVISIGDSSLTDTTLIRKFSRRGPLKIIYETRGQIFINKDLTVKDALLDLAHELTHFAMRPAFNPYSENFGPVSFIRSTVEGKGGEIEAFLVECAVLKDLFPASSYWSSNCSKVGNSKKQGIIEYYKVGKFYEKFKNKFKDFPYLSPQKPLIISSVYGLPYPIAAFKEYKTIIKKVCQNNRKQLGLIQKNESPQFWQLKQKIESRCQNIYSLLHMPIH
ncbi:MAG: hypothetical protein DRQ88_11620 [Epsilonproteobacteria bacterium]|nr:MAG: hypothetical protein DRQ89_08045 [Campylobacterota bacterium]RLA64034.1 MAG: hypothetical protein DRQ88_11620 [Campylobacterota bacterium]